jgi:hypothetical protein
MIIIQSYSNYEGKQLIIESIYNGIEDWNLLTLDIGKKIIACNQSQNRCDIDKIKLLMDIK